MLPGRGLGWTQTGPNFVASLVPFHFAAGSGGFQRIAPIGASAYGMPLKTRRSPTASPCTEPAGVATTGGTSARADKPRQNAINTNTSRVTGGLHSMIRVSTHAPATGTSAQRARRKEPGYRKPSARSDPD